MTEIQNFKYVLVIEDWYLRFICNLMLGIWDGGDEMWDVRRGIWGISYYNK
jgi:hypothetical protein